jgi:uncharacterized protein (TIGR02284 family)
MENNNEQLVSDLKELLSICNDGKEGYRNAAENVDAPELKSLLTTYSIQRSEYASVLKTAIQQLGGDPDNEIGGPLGVLHRAWIDIKTAFTTNDNKAVLEACVTGEKAAEEAYDKVILNSPLEATLRSKLIDQLAGIRSALSNVSQLEEQYA